MASTLERKRPTTTRFACLAPAPARFSSPERSTADPKATPMRKDVAGNWGVEVPLPPGHHEFKFVIDGPWCCDPGCEGTYHGCPKCVPNSSGTMNRLIEVTQP